MLVIHAKIREKKGKSFSRKLRLENQLPAIIYGLNQAPISITLDHNSVFNLQKKVDFYKNILLLSMKNQKYKVKVHAIQRHPFKLKLMHIDFLYV